MAGLDDSFRLDKFVIGVCAFTVLQTVQRPGVCSAVYGAVHYKEPFDKSKA